MELRMKVTYKKIRSLRIGVHPPNGEVRVSAPLGMSPATVQHFVSKKMNWIQFHQQRIRSQSQEIKKASPELLRLLNQQVPEILGQWMHRMELKDVTWRLRDMRTRWGTCNPRRRRITLSLALANYPPECLEYVIVHELVHLSIPNHGPLFKSRLDELIPNWRARQRILNPKRGS
jgi:predicted metal-dependent hydrolase